MIERDSTVLPDPDSPTMPNVRPRSSDSDTCWTAATDPRGESNVVQRSSTWRSGPLAGASRRAGATACARGS